VPGGLQGEVKDIAGMEHRLSSMLGQTRYEVCHAECLDSEERAEVYAILDALQSETEAHKKTIKFLAGRMVGGADA
jgi:hypothetical protein